MGRVRDFGLNGREWSGIFRAGLFTESFPVPGVNGVSKVLHSGKSGRFFLLSHDVLDAFCQTGVIAVAENTIIPASSDCKAVEIDVVVYNMLIVMHFQIVNSVFSIGNGINRTKLGAESADKGRPVV